MRTPILWVVAGLLGLAASARAEDVTGNLKLKRLLGDVTLSGKWIYDDLDAGFDEARRTGKPLFAYLRCVP
jgi:hypothetical protein